MSSHYVLFHTMRTASQHALAENDSVFIIQDLLYTLHNVNKLRLKAYRGPHRTNSKVIYAILYKTISERHKTEMVTNRLVDAILLLSVVHGSDSLVNNTMDARYPYL